MKKIKKLRIPNQNHSLCLGIGQDSELRTSNSGPRTKFIILVISLLIFSCIAKEDIPRLSGNLTDFCLTGYTPAGEKSWQMHSEQAQVEPNFVHFIGVKGTSFSNTSFDITAGKGYFNKKKNKLWLWGGMSAIVPDGSLIKADDFWWDVSSGEMGINGPLIWYKTNLIARAIGVRSEGGQNATFLKSIYVKVNPGMFIHCNGPAYVDCKTGLAKLQDNVVITTDTMEIHSYYLFVKFDSKEGVLQKAVALGNVYIVRESDKTHCSRAIFIFTENKLVLESSRVSIDTKGEDGWLKEFNSGSKK